MTVDERLSPNEGPRPHDAAITLVVIHGTEGSDAGDLSWLTDADSGVSYHYLIQRTGRIWRLVPESRRAWHAGKSAWRGVTDVNDFSIGIGLSCRRAEPYTDKHYEALGWLLHEIAQRHQLGMDDVVGHYHVAPGRKSDPWESFEWGRAFEEMRRG